MRAALRMQETLAAHTAELDVDIRMRVGVNTGEVLVGALRAGGDYTAMGDVVNTANRLQGAAQPGEVLVGPATFAATRRTVRYETLEPIAAKGREELVPAWRADGAVAPPGYRPERNRARLIGREPELGPAVPQRGERHLQRPGVAAAPPRRGRCRASHGWPRSWPATPRSSTTRSSSRGAACPTARRTSGGRWPTPCATVPASARAIPTDKAIELARTSVCIALGEDATTAEVDRVHQGLLYLMGYESELRAIDPARAREEATSAVVTYAERFSAHRPVVVVLSDLHWADDLVLELVDTLLDRLSTRKFVVLATARQAIEERWHPPHGRHNLVVLTLDPLTSESAEALLCELAGIRPRLRPGQGAARPQRRQPVLPRGARHPPVGCGHGRHAPGHGDHEDHVDLPDTLRGLVVGPPRRPHRRRAARPRRLRRARSPRPDDGDRGHGREAPRHRRRAAGRSSRSRPRSCWSLSGSGEGEKWTFRSDLVREVAYSTLTKGDRARSHFGIAIWMEAHEDTDRDAVVDRITYHYVRAAELLIELGPVDGPAEGPHRAGAALARAGGRPRQPGGHPGGGRAALQRGAPAARRAARPPAPRRSSPAGRAPSPVCARSHRPEPTPWRRWRRAAKGATTRSRTSVGRCWCSADIEQKGSSWAASEDALDEAGRVFAALGDASGEAEVLRFRGFGALTRHEYATATELLEQALARYEELEDRRGVAWVRQNLAWCAFYSGRAEEAEMLLRKAAATFEEIGDQGGLRWARGLLAWARFQQGHWPRRARWPRRSSPTIVAAATAGRSA